MGAGRNVRLFLVDGSMNGLVTAEIMSWTGHLLLAPRLGLGEALKRPESSKTGVYFLVGDDPDHPTRKKVYIGEGDDISVRIKLHGKDESKEFWDKTIFVTSKDTNLTKAHVRYLEGRLIELAKASGNATVANEQTPGPKALPESDKADMESFLEQIQLILPVVGFDFLRPQPQAPLKDAGAEKVEGVTPSLELELIAPKHFLNAYAIAVGDEVTVLKGSQALTEEFVVNSYAPLRQQLMKDGTLSPVSGSSLLTFSRNVTFSSPSAAAAVVFNRNMNGRTAWTLKGTSKTLKEWQEEQLNSLPIQRQVP